MGDPLSFQFGRNFSLSLQVSDPPPASVPPRILSKLVVFTPAPELVDAYLAEIARGYGVPYASAGDVPPMEGEGGESGGEGGDGDGKVEEHKEDKEESKDEASRKATPEVEQPKPVADKPRAQPTVVKKPTAEDELAARFEKLKSLR